MKLFTIQKTYSQLLLLMSIVFSIQSFAQVGIGTTTPEASALLDITSQNRGFLPPRMTEAQRDAILPAAEGLVVYNTDEKCINFYNGDDWISICNPGGTPPPPLPGNIVLTGGQKAYIASVYDENYLPYGSITTVADTGSSDAGGPTETLIDIQGVLNTTTGLTVAIPYNVSSGNVDLDAFSETKTVISDHIQGTNPLSNHAGGTAIDVIFSYDAQTNLSGAGTILATIKAVDNDLNAVKLDINKGIGTDLGILLAEFTFALDDDGNTGTVQLKDIPGIPDRRFGELSKTGATNLTDGVLGLNHNNLYLPIQTANGKIWLNNNLGANYSNLNSGVFNISQQAMTPDDKNAYGSLYQWGRYSDGHELIDYTGSGSIQGSGKNGIWATNPNIDNPDHSLFIVGNATFDDWRGVQNNNLWQGVSGINNPCPDGFKVPSAEEYSQYLSTETPTITNAPTAHNSILKLSQTGQRTAAGSGSIDNDGNAASPVMFGWTRTVPSTQLTHTIQLSIFPTSTNITSANTRGKGSFIRCIQHVEEPTTIPTNMTLVGNKVSYVASINDADYLPYTASTRPAQLSPKIADGTVAANETLIDIPGTLTTTGQTISIPYTSSGSPTYDAYSYTVTVHDSLTDDAMSRQVNFSYPAGTATSPSGSILMTIKSIGGILNLKKLDINNGLGNGTATEGSITTGVYGVLVAEVPIYINDANTIQHIQLRNTAGIPDRRFGEQTKTGSTNLTDGVLGFNHNNLYFPVQAPNGRLWLNNHLGANYSDVNHPVFNPAKQATLVPDHNAYGSMFQWGRYSDGHELVTYTNSTTGNMDNATIGTKSTTDNVGHNLFIIRAGAVRYDWRATPNNTLWSGVSGINNPCPVGFRLPTQLEFENYKQSFSPSLSNATDGFQSTLKLTQGGQRNSTNGSVDSEGHYTAMFCWTGTIVPSAVNEDKCYAAHGFNHKFTTTSDRTKLTGYPVRCILD